MKNAASNLLSVGLFVALIYAMAYAIAGALTEPSPSIPPCEYEDSAGPCYWDADSMGNGMGDSFVVDESGAVEYVDPQELIERFNIETPTTNTQPAITA